MSESGWRDRLSDPSFIEVRHPVHRRLRLGERCERVQFSEPLSAADHRALARALARRPDVELRAYGFYEEPFDLDFLEHYPRLDRFWLDVHDLDDLSGLERLGPELRSLSLGMTKSTRHSLAFLERFPRLEDLYIESHRKDLETIARLPRLTDLTLRSIPLGRPSFLAELPNLRSLALNLGSATDLSPLGRIGRLRQLKIWRVRGVEELSFLGDCVELQYLILQSLGRVVALPDLARLTRLRRLHLESLGSLNGLEAVATAPALRDLAIWDLKQLEVDDFRPLLAHPMLRRIDVGLGSVRRDRAVYDLLGKEAFRALEVDFEFEGA